MKGVIPAKNSVACGRQSAIPFVKKTVSRMAYFVNEKSGQLAHHFMSRGSNKEGG